MNKNEDDIILREALDALQETTGIKGYYTLADFSHDRGLDAEVRLELENGGLVFWADVKREMRHFHLMNKPLTDPGGDYPLLYVVDRLYPQIKEELRKRKISYIDTAGNVYIQHANTYIWIDGQKKLQTERTTGVNRAFTKQGLKVVFQFLWQQEMINQTYRKIAEQTGVALGNIPLIMEGLKDAGYLLPLDKKKFVIQKKKALLDRWIEGYRDILKPTLHIGNFRAANRVGLRNMLVDGIHQDVYVGGELAAERITQYLNPEVYTVYTDLRKNEIMVKLQLIPTTAEGNVQVYEKFWNNSPDVPMHYPQTPDLLVYADLMITDEPRCLETAEILYNNNLKHEFE
jgi:hypothetical protein